MNRYKQLFQEYSSNEDIISRFFTCPSRQIGNRHLFAKPQGQGCVLINYSTPIAYIDGEGNAYMNKTKYSRTTSVIQSKIRYIGRSHNLVEVPEQELKEIMNSSSSSSKEYNEIDFDPNEYPDDEEMPEQGI